MILGLRADRGNLEITVFILIDYPLHIATISMELSILYFKGLSIIIPIKCCISVSEVQTLMKCC